MSEEQKINEESTLWEFISDVHKYVNELSGIRIIFKRVGLRYPAYVEEERKKRSKEFLEKTEKYTDDKNNVYYRVIKTCDLEFLNRRRIEFEKMYTSKNEICRSLFISIVSKFDAFVAYTIKFILKNYKDARLSSNTQVNFSEIEKYSTIEDLRNVMIDKIAEDELYGTHADFIASIQKHAKIDLKLTSLDFWSRYIELTERRNLFVHCDGIVSQKYINVCSQHNALSENIELKTKLTLDETYFHEAYRTLVVLNVIIAFRIVLKIFPTQKNRIYSELTNLTYMLIYDEEFDLAVDLLTYFTNQSFIRKEINDETYRRWIINLAQAFKWSGKSKDCLTILNGVQWSASSNIFKLAYYVLCDDIDKVLNLMPKMKHEETFSNKFYMEWPLFKEIKKIDKFQKKYEELYNEKFELGPQPIPQKDLF